MLGSVGSFRFRFGEEGSYTGDSSSTGASCIRFFFALGLDGALFRAPFGLPFALGLITGFTSSATGGSGFSSGMSSAISCIYSATSSGISRISSGIYYIEIFKTRLPEQIVTKN